MPDKGDSSRPEQLAKFKEAARQLECDEDEARWDERLKKVAKPRKDAGGGGAGAD